MMRRLLAIAIIGISGCSALGPDDIDERAEYARHRAAWSRLSIHDYTTTSSYSCFCPVEFLRPVVMQVSGDSIVSVHDLETGEPVPPGPYALANVYHTIDRLFDIIDNRLRHGFVVEVEYHPVLHYPRSIESHLPNTADSEFSHTVAEFDRID